MESPSLHVALWRAATKRRFSRLTPLVKRLWRPFPEWIYRFFDRRFDRIDQLIGNPTFDLYRLREAIDSRTVDAEDKGQTAPHIFTIKINYFLQKRTALATLESLKHTIHAAVIDHINDKYYRTLDSVRIDMNPDIYTSGVTVEPSFGKFDKVMSARRVRSNRAKILANTPPSQIRLVARIDSPGFKTIEHLTFHPGGPSLSVGSAEGNDLVLSHASVSPRHATLAVTAAGILQVADLASTTGTFVNRLRISYRQSRTIRETRDTVSFGRVKIRFRKSLPGNPSI